MIGSNSTDSHRASSLLLQGQHNQRTTTSFPVLLTVLRYGKRVRRNRGRWFEGGRCSTRGGEPARRPRNWNSRRWAVRGESRTRFTPGDIEHSPPSVAICSTFLPCALPMTSSRSGGGTAAYMSGVRLLSACRTDMARVQQTSPLHTNLVHVSSTRPRHTSGPARLCPHARSENSWSIPYTTTR